MALFTLSLLSCASVKDVKSIKEIKEAQYDGLKYESLTRYDGLRLDNSLKAKNTVALCHKGEFEKANKLFKEKLDKNLNNYLYWNQISTCYILNKKYTQARKFLDIAMGMAKTSKQKSKVLNNIGVIYLENKNYHEAKDYFLKSSELSKRSLTPKFNLVQIYLKFGLYRNAKHELKILLDINAHDVDFLNSKAHLELMQKNYKSALLYFNKIPKRYKTRDDIATNLGMTYFMLGLYENAKNVINNADKEDINYKESQLDILEKLEKRIVN